MPDGSIADGVLLVSERDDAYDTFPYFAIDDGTNGLELYANPAETCTYEAGGRQVALPTSTTAAGLELSRKVYVPATGPGFARFYNQVHNPAAPPRPSRSTPRPAASATTTATSARTPAPRSRTARPVVA